MPDGPIRLRREPKKVRGRDISWTARLTHPLVFFAGALIVCESVIGTALLRSHSDEAIFKLSVVMAIVIIAAMAFVAFLVFTKPKHLMLSQQDTIADDLRLVERIRDVAIIFENPERPRNFEDLMALMRQAEDKLTKVKK
jgi:heme A synthase